MDVNIIPFSRHHWEAVSEIYLAGIKMRNATFETDLPDFEDWNKKFHSHLRWVATCGGTIAGWSGLIPVSNREAYTGVTEVSIYVHPDFQGLGVGKKLMQHLIKESEEAGIWTLYAALFPENTASIQLHQAMGFRKIGYRERIARLDGIWRDTVIFERRSKTAGT